MAKKSKKEKAATKAGVACRNVLGDDRLCDKVYEKAMAGPGPAVKRKRRESDE
jgi:hypothetical protein